MNVVLALVFLITSVSILFYIRHREIAKCGESYAKIKHVRSLHQYWNPVWCAVLGAFTVLFVLFGMFALAGVVMALIWYYIMAVMPKQVVKWRIRRERRIWDNLGDGKYQPIIELIRRSKDMEYFSPDAAHRSIYYNSGDHMPSSFNSEEVCAVLGKATSILTDGVFDNLSDYLHHLREGQEKP